MATATEQHQQSQQGDQHGHQQQKENEEGKEEEEELKTSEPVYARAKSKDVPWWLESIEGKVREGSEVSLPLG